MEHRPRVRITLTDLRDLARVHENLTGSIMALNESKWAGSIPMIVSLQQADRVVCRLYNKAERSFSAKTIGADNIPSAQLQAAGSQETSENG